MSAAFEQNDLSFVGHRSQDEPQEHALHGRHDVQVPGLLGDRRLHLGRARAAGDQPKFDTSGWFAQAGFFLKPEKWEIAARYGEQDPSDLVGPDKITEIRGGLNYFYARHALKVQLDYGQIKTETSSGDRKNNELRIQTQFIF